MAAGSADTAKGPETSEFREALGRCRGGMVAVAAFSLCINLLMLTAPIYMLQIFDRVLSGRSVDTLLYLTLIAAAAFAALALLEAARNHAMVRLGTWLDQRLGGEVLSTGVIGGLRAGRSASVQGLRDLGAIRAFIAGPAIFPILDAPWTPIFIIVIFLLHPLLGWLALSGAVILLVIAVINEAATRGLLRRSGEASIDSLNQAQAAARNADVIEAMGMMPSLVRRWRRQNAHMLDLLARASRRGGRISALSKFVRLNLQIGVLGLGAWLVLENTLTPGAMIAASILVGRALGPVDMAIGSWKSAVAARGAFARLKRQLGEDTGHKAAMALPPPKGELAVEKVTYAYPGMAEPVLRDIGFRLAAGESLGLIGPTAAGKTTLARLLVGNLRPQRGHVRLDGVDVAQWPADDLGPYVGYLPQDVELFAATVGENIARLDEGEPEAVIEAAQLADVHDMILRLPGGYDTEIGEGGATLSGGQRQRIGLARALYGTPRLVVLDEPNASLDRTGEAALLAAITRLAEQGVTAVVIAHRPSVLRLVDKVLVLRDGRVQMFGPRDEVVAKVTGPEKGEPTVEPTERRHG